MGISLFPPKGLSPLIEEKPQNKIILMDKTQVEMPDGLAAF